MEEPGAKYNAHIPFKASQTLEGFQQNGFGIKIKFLVIFFLFS